MKKAKNFQPEKNSYLVKALLSQEMYTNKYANQSSTNYYY